MTNKYLIKIAANYIGRGYINPYWQESSIAREHGKTPQSVISFYEETTKHTPGIGHRLGDHISSMVKPSLLGAGVGALTQVGKGTARVASRGVLGGIIGASTGSLVHSIQDSHQDLKNNADRAHEKYAAFSEKQKNTVASVGIGGLAAAATAAHEVEAGNLTGRKTLFHGTAKAYAEAIRKDGLHPNKSPGATDAVEKETRMNLKSKGLSFTTSNLDQARTYATQSEHVHEHGLDKFREGQLAASYGVHKGGVVKLNVPTWKYKTIKNPEIRAQVKQTAGLIKAYSREGGKSLTETKKSRKIQYERVKQLFADDTVFKGSVGTEHIHGSPNYTRNSAKEIGSFLKHSPGRVAKAVGRIGGLGLAAGTLAYGAGKANKYFDKVRSDKAKNEK